MSAGESRHIDIRMAANRGLAWSLQRSQSLNQSVSHAGSYLNLRLRHGRKGGPGRGVGGRIVSEDVKIHDIIQTRHMRPTMRPRVNECMNDDIITRIVA